MAQCENCKLLTILDEDKINWYDQLSQQNVELHRKLMEQQDLITLLRQQLLKKQSSRLTQVVSDTFGGDENSQKVEKSAEDHVKDKTQAVSDLIIVLNEKIESFQDYIEENEQQYSWHISYLNGLESNDVRDLHQGPTKLKLNLNEVTNLTTIIQYLSNKSNLVRKILGDPADALIFSLSLLTNEDGSNYFHNFRADYYRDSLFTELKMCNELKRRFINEISNIASISETVILDRLKIEEEKINNEVRTRYKQTIQKSKDEIERLNQLVTKLRKHNRQIYTVMHNNKKSYDEHLANSKKEMDALKALIKQLRHKINFLQTRLKLDVEGCQNDILDARRRIKTLTNVKQK